MKVTFVKIGDDDQLAMPPPISVADVLLVKVTFVRVGDDPE